MKFFVVISAVVLITPICTGEIQVHEENSGTHEITIDHEYLIFDKGKRLKDVTYLKTTDPPTGCEQMYPPPMLKFEPSWILLTDDKGCDAHTKIINAQNAGYDGLVIISDSNTPTKMEIREDLKEKYKINVSFIGYMDGLNLKNFLFRRKSNRYILTIQPTTPKVIPKKPEKSWPDTDFQLSKNWRWIKSWFTWRKIRSFTIVKIIADFFQVIYGLGEILLAPGIICFILNLMWNNGVGGRAQEEEPQPQQRSNARRPPPRPNRNEQHQQQHRNNNAEHEEFTERLTTHLEKLIKARTLLKLPRYGVLTRAEIFKAFRDLSPLTHPDKFPEAEKARKNREFQELNSAKDFLIENLV